MRPACPLCLAESAERVTDRTRDGSGVVYRCGACRHVFLDLGMPRPDLEAFLAEFYRSDAQRRDGLEDRAAYVDRIKADNVRRLAVCAPLLRPGSTVLDVGAGYGLFARLAAPFASRVTVVDRSELTRANAEAFGLAYAATIDAVTGRFSLVVAFHTVEHFIDPETSLHELAARLDDDGTLVVEVPNVGDLLVRAAPRYRPFYYQTAHLHYFAAHTLRATLARAGLRVRRAVPTQRYGLSNHVRWIGGRDLAVPAWVDGAYRALLARTPLSDTLLYLCEHA